jgi:hypothetical protein
MLKRTAFTLIMLLLVSYGMQTLAATDPIAYYSFDELGDVITDDSGNERDGTPVGNLEFSEDGKMGKSFKFNGVDSYVELKKADLDDFDDFTFTAWIKPDGPGHKAGEHAFDGSGIIWSDASGPTNDFAAALLGTKLAFHIGTPNTTITSETDIVTGDWVHIAVTRNSATGDAAIYVNGKMEASMQHPNKNPLQTMDVVVIGANVRDNRYYTGLIDEVKFFDTVLGEAEIQQLTAPVESSDRLAITWGEIRKSD